VRRSGGRGETSDAPINTRRGARRGAPAHEHGRAATVATSTPRLACQTARCLASRVARRGCPPLGVGLVFACRQAVPSSPRVGHDSLHDSRRATTRHASVAARVSYTSPISANRVALDPVVACQQLTREEGGPLPCTPYGFQPEVDWLMRFTRASYWLSEFH